MILTATPAPAVDQTVHLDQVRLGEAQRVDPPVIRPGGKGINVARVLASRGHAVRAVTTQGGAEGELLERCLSHLGVDARWVRVGAPTRRSTAWVEASGRTTVLNEQAGAWTEAECEAWLDSLAVAVEGASAAALCGSWPAGAPAGWVSRTLEVLAAGGAYTVADTSGPLLLTAAAAGASLLKPNLEELAEATGTRDVQAGLGVLFGLGAHEVLLSRGPDGMSHHTREDPAGLHARLDAVLTGNPTGAGDAAVAGWLSVVAPLGQAPFGAERERALRTAVAWSASAVLAPVAGELTEDAERFMQRVQCG